MGDSPWREYRHAQLRAQRREGERTPHEDAPQWDEALTPGLRRVMLVEFTCDAWVVLHEFDPFTPQYKNPREPSPTMRTKYYALEGTTLRAWHVIDAPTYTRLILGACRVMRAPLNSTKVTAISEPKGR